MTLRDKVFSNLDSARENGYFETGEMLHDANDHDVACDMIAYAEDVEDVEPEAISPFVAEWRAQANL